MTRAILVLCETCQSEGRIYTCDGPNEIDHGKCPDCDGTGMVLVDSEAMTFEEALEADAEKLQHFS